MVVAMGHGTIQKLLYGWDDEDEDDKDEDGETNGTKRNQVSQTKDHFV